ncbi:MAG: HTH domain-containing protein, partial [Clostridiales bacterium]|nr:HTH domain-containing protein [Clostridiales bacterium]
MRSDQRRAAILSTLQQETAPVSASALARQYGVSRQIIVGDVALLRAAGADIAATPRGYVLNRAPAGGG